MIRKAAIAWVLMIPVAILNGGLRNALFEPWAGELRAHQLSVLTGSLAFLGVAYALLRKDVEDKPDRTLLGLGVAWVVATIAFEFVFGHWVMGNTWSKLLADYNVAEGRLWPIVLLVLGTSPLLVKRLGARVLDEQDNIEAREHSHRLT